MHLWVLCTGGHGEREVQVRINDTLEERKVGGLSVVERPIEVKRLMGKTTDSQTDLGLGTNTSDHALFLVEECLGFFDTRVSCKDLKDTGGGCLLLAHATDTTVSTASVCLLSQHVFPQLPTIRVTLLRNLGKRPASASPWFVAASVAA